MHPERVQQLLLIGTKPPDKVNHPMEEIFLKTAYIEDYSFEDEIILFFEPISEQSVQAARANHDRIAARVNKDINIKPALWQHYGMGSEDFIADTNNIRGYLKKTSIPILVISENWFELNRQLPTTQVVVIPRAGHGPHHQHPQMVTRYIHAFLEHHS